MERVCFVLHLKPDRVEDYLAAHRQVWPEMLDALHEAGWHNYSLFVQPSDGLVVGYLETNDFPQALAAMASQEVNARWQRGMAQYFAELDGVNPDEGLERLSEYFHLA
jgi:L-rhamnose mutarotase